MQIFHRSTNTISKVTIFGFILFLVFLGWLVAKLTRSAYATGVELAGSSSRLPLTNT